jgi:predicted transcriptional regulator
MTKKISLKGKVLGSLEQQVMHVLWEYQSPLKPCDVRKKLGESHAYTTIMTVMSRMAGKGLLRRKLVGRAYAYSPNVTRQRFVKTRVAKLYSGLMKEYGDLAIAEFIEIARSDPQNMHLLKECFCSGCACKGLKTKEK